MQFVTQPPVDVGLPDATPFPPRVRMEEGDPRWVALGGLNGGFSVPDLTWKGYVPPEHWFSGLRAYTG
jgi:hypothetical protein